MEIIHPYAITRSLVPKALTHPHKINTLLYNINYLSARTSLKVNKKKYPYVAPPYSFNQTFILILCLILSFIP